MASGISNFEKKCSNVHWSIISVITGGSFGLGYTHKRSDNGNNPFVVPRILPHSPTSHPLMVSSDSHRYQRGNPNPRTKGIPLTMHALHQSQLK